MDKIKFNSQIRPKDNPHHFDAHIYFNSSELHFITLLRDKIKSYFDPKLIFVGNIIPHAIGPHPKGMLEVNFGEADFQEFVFFLMEHRGDLIALIHSISQYDYLDHTKGAIWLGGVVELDLAQFTI